MAVTKKLQVQNHLWTLTHDHLVFYTRAQQENQVCQECPELMALLYVSLLVFFFLHIIKMMSFARLELSCLHFLGSPRKGGASWNQRKPGWCQP